MSIVNLPEPLGTMIKSLEPKTITNFFGPPGVGKTNICILALKDCINKGKKAIYIDSEGGLSIERLKQIASNHQEILENTILVEPKNFKEQSEKLKALPLDNVGLIILDSAVALYRLEFSGDYKQESGQQKNNSRLSPENQRVLDANRELSKQLASLSTIAREHDIPVVVTCHTFKNWLTGADEVVGGESIKYWSKAIVFLEKTGRHSERKATLLKHRFLPEGISVKFEITQEGIKPSGFKFFG